MRLASYLVDGQPHAGVVASDETLIAVGDLVAGGPSDMLGLLAAGPSAWARVHSAAATATGGLALKDTRLVAPIPRPRRNLFCVGWNYSEHFAESQGAGARDENTPPIPDYPALFSKQPNTVVGPDAPVWHSAPISDELDWEVELAVIIGTPGRNIAEEYAFEHVFGYTVGNDVSVRDVQWRHSGQWFKGKSFDSHCPMGPWIVTADELGDPHALHISLRVNGVTKQDANTKQMAFRIPRIVKEI